MVRSELQKALDSYQEDDLNRLRQRWSDALAKRKEVSFYKTFQLILETNIFTVQHFSW